MAFSKKYLPLAVAALGFLIILAAGTYRLSESPGIWFDEGMYTQTAMNLAERGLQGIQVAPGEFVSASTVTGGFPFIAPIALSYKLFGVGVLQGRVVMLLFILAFAAAAYVLTSLLFGWRQGAWTLLLLSSFAMLYGNGKSVLGEIPGLFYLILSCIALLYLERSSYRSLVAYAALGLAAGLCVVTKPIFMLLLPAFFFAWVMRWRSVPIRWQGFLWGLAAFLIPIAVWLRYQFAGESLTSILSFYANPYTVPDLAALVASNIRRFFADTTALYTLILLSAWAAALFIRWKQKSRASIVELVAFFFSIIIIAASLRLPGWNRYVFPATTIALLFFPHACVSLFGWVRAKLPRALRIEWVPYAFLTLMFFGQLYQVAFSSYVADYYHAHRTQDVAEALTALGPDASVFVYNAPEVVVLLPSDTYYQFIKPYADNDTALFGADQLPLLLAGKPDYVIVGTNDPASSTPYFSSYRFMQKFNRYSLFEKP